MTAFAISLSFLLGIAVEATRADLRTSIRRDEAPSGLSFMPVGNGQYEFDTGVLRGKLRTGGRSLGLSSVVHIATGKALDRSNGLFGHYRVFSDGKRYGNGAWDWPSDARLLPDGAVEVQWPALGPRPFIMTATYRWSSASILDLVTEVQPKADLRGFESFLASYFNEAFNNASFYVGASEATGGKAGFQRADRALGTWLMSPRDAESLLLVKDGRWTLEPNPVDWVMMPRFAAPMGMRRDPTAGLTALVMAPASDCFAVSMPHESEGHCSLYLSLFGRDLKTGEIARARARLLIGSGITEQTAASLYEEYRKAGSSS